MNGIANAISRVKDFADLALAPLTALRDAVQTVINLIAKIPSRIKLPELPSFDIPFFADGGIVTQPTLGVIGEAGPEAVIPLDQLGSTGGSTGGGTQRVEIVFKNGAEELFAATVNSVNRHTSQETPGYLQNVGVF